MQVPKTKPIRGNKVKYFDSKAHPFQTFRSHPLQMIRRVQRDCRNSVVRANQLLNEQTKLNLLFELD